MERKINFFNFFVILIGIFSYGLIPIPIFFDLVNFSIILSTEAFPILQVPIPISLLLFSIGVVIYHMVFIFNKNDFLYFISDKNFRYIIFSFSVILFLWMYFLSNIELLKIIQIMLPLLGAIFFIYPKNIKLLRGVLNFTIGTAIIFCSLHLISLYINNHVDFLNLTEFEFPYFFNISIYQSLVSYPGVIFIYFTIVFYRSVKSIKKYKVVSFMYILVCTMFLSLLGFAARRVSVFELSILFFILSLISAGYIIKYRKLSRKIVYYVNFFLPILILFICLLRKFPLGQRFNRTYQDGQFDSGRLDIYGKAMHDLSNNLEGLFLGQPGKSGYHNYFLDMLYNIGIIPILILFSMVSLYFIYNNKKIFNYILKVNWFNTEVILITGCFSSLLMQSMVNASITQPYYLINLLILVLYCIVSKKERMLS